MFVCPTFPCCLVFCCVFLRGQCLKAYVIPASKLDFLSDEHPVSQESLTQAPLDISDFAMSKGTHGVGCAFDCYSLLLA